MFLFDTRALLSLARFQHSPSGCAAGSWIQSDGRQHQGRRRRLL